MVHRIEEYARHCGTRTSCASPSTDAWANNRGHDPLHCDLAGRPVNCSSTLLRRLAVGLHRKLMADT